MNSKSCTVTSCVALVSDRMSCARLVPISKRTTTTAGIILTLHLSRKDRHSSLRDRPPDRRGNNAELVHEFRELLRIERLRAVGQCLIRLMMHFHQQRV